MNVSDVLRAVEEMLGLPPGALQSREMLDAINEDLKAWTKQ